MDELPVTQSLTSYVNLAPSVHRTGPDGGFSIAGAMSFANVYLINGVQAQDNIYGTPLNLYIEDAVEEAAFARRACRPNTADSPAA